MSTKIDANQFKKDFCDTLQTDNKGTYFKVYADNYTELALYNYYLAKSISYISQAMEILPKKDFQEVAYSIGYLTNILEATTLYTECEGIDKMIKE